MLLRSKKETFKAAIRADKTIVNIVENETWAELKTLVPYAQYCHPRGLSDHREQIKAENEGVVVPVGNASRASFRFGACALEFVEDRVC